MVYSSYSLFFTEKLLMISFSGTFFLFLIFIFFTAVCY